MSIEQKLAELERLAEQLDEAKRSVKKEAAEDDKEDEPDDKEKDTDSDIENDDEAEELDELSKATVARYAKAAPKSAATLNTQAKKTATAGLDIIQKGANRDQSDRLFSMAGNLAHKAANRMQSHKKAIGRLTKEDLDESKVDLGDLFSGQELSEEFKQKATTVFEAAVAVRVKQELAELEESFEQQQLDEAVVLKESLVDKVDGYLDYVVEQWMNKNELAINRGIKTEILESFVSGMKQVFESHYIDVPDEKYDLVEAVKSEKEDLEQRLNEQTESIMHLKKNIKEMQKQFAIEESCKGLAETDAEKLRVFAEELVFSTVDEFTEKLVLIQENYLVVKKPHSKVLAEEFMTDVPIETIQESARSMDPSMQRYLKAIEKSGF